VLKVIESVSDALSVIATYVLLTMAALLLLQACWAILDSLWITATSSGPILESISLIIIAFAVLELSKFIADELIEKKRELRSARGARRPLTRFITTIIIAFSLEALVMVFEANRRELGDAIYLSDGVVRSGGVRAGRARDLSVAQQQGRAVRRVDRRDRSGTAVPSDAPQQTIAAWIRPI